MTAGAPESRAEKRVAVMQPYFLPYAGYFRLFNVVDEFVIYDCVQFARRGRVHRTQVPGVGGGEWLTLPLARQPRETRIRELRFAPDARASFDQRLAHLPWVAAARGPAAARVRDYLHGPLDDVVGFLERGLALVCDLLDLPFHVTRSSSLELDPALRGQDRVLAVATARRATTYVNAPGGIELYDADAFREHGVALRFLAPYDGPYRLLLPALLTADPSTVGADVRETSLLVDGVASTGAGAGREGRVAPEPPVGGEASMPDPP